MYEPGILAHIDVARPPRNLGVHDHDDIGLLQGLHRVGAQVHGMIEGDVHVAGAGLAGMGHAYAEVRGDASQHGYIVEMPAGIRRDNQGVLRRGDGFRHLADLRRLRHRGDGPQRPRPRPGLYGRRRVAQDFPRQH